jgi:tetratricopeptide (TPR) repeat protein
VLVTSRPPLREIQITSGAIPIKLPVLSETEASELIKKVAGRENNQREIENDEQAIQGIAELCGYLPLAITIAVAPMAEEPHVTFADRLARLKSVPNLLFAPDEYDDVAMGGVARSFELSYMQLPDERKLVLRRLGLAPVPSFRAEAVAALSNQPVAAARAHLHRLRAEALIEEDGDGYRVHDLIRDYSKGLAAEDNPADNAAAVDQLLAYYRQAAAYVDSVVTRQPPPIAIEPPVPAVHHQFADRSAAIAWARAELPNLSACAQYVVHEADGPGRDREKAWVVMLAGALAGFLRNDGLWLQSIDLQTSAITAAQQLRLPLGQANALHERGLLYRLSGQLRNAVADLEQALAIYREIGGHAGETGEAHVLNTLGVVLDQLKRSAEGTERLASSLAAYRRLGNHLGEANALHDEGMAKYFAQHYTEAADLLSQALALYQSVDNLLGQAHAHSNLAKAQNRTGLDHEAADHLNAAGELYHQLGNRLGEATVLTQLGTALRRQGNYEQAANQFRSAEELNTDIGNQLGRATTLKEWGELCIAIGDIPGAKEWLTRSLELFRKYGIQRDEAGPIELLRSLGLMDEPEPGSTGGIDT